MVIYRGVGVGILNYFMNGVCRFEPPFTGWLGYRLPSRVCVCLIRRVKLVIYHPLNGC